MNRARPVVAIVLALLALLSGCDRGQAARPDRANFTAAVTDYLAQRGHLCIGRYDWPVDVAQADRRAGTPAAQQMDVLESQGLVAGRDVGAGRRYELTAAGREDYLHVPIVLATPGRRVVHPADFCVARLSLDRVFGWEAPRTLAGRAVSSVLFSYRIDAAPWTRTPAARRAFPLVIRAIDNAGSLQLRLGVHLTPRGWVADELTD